MAINIKAVLKKVEKLEKTNKKLREENKRLKEELKKLKVKEVNKEVNKTLV